MKRMTLGLAGMLLLGAGGWSLGAGRSRPAADQCHVGRSSTRPARIGPDFAALHPGYHAGEPPKRCC